MKRVVRKRADEVEVSDDRPWLWSRWQVISPAAAEEEEEDDEGDKDCQP